MVIRSVIIEAATFALLAVVLALCLFAGHNEFQSLRIPLVPDLLALFREPSTQWMAFLCACAYVGFFTMLTHRRPGARFWRVRNPDLWLLILLTFASLAYLHDYSTASETTHALTLMTAVALGKVVRFWALREPQPDRIHRAITCVIFLLIILFAVALLWPSQTASGFQYREQVRWRGPWDNPNIYGLLMGVGVILATGQALILWARPEKPSVETSREVVSLNPTLQGWMTLRGITVLGLAMIALVMATGLLRSYSRGAWVAFALAMIYLASTSIADGHRRQAAFSRWLRQNAISLALIIAASFVLGFWQFRHTEIRPLRRVFSIVNLNDFSWRNRVAAYEGALQMVAEKPMGFGWNRPERVYDHYYRDTKVAQPMAIQMNDYLMVGTTLGILPVLGLAGYLALVVFPRAPAVRSDLSRTVCRSAAFVLAVGFWFDGGLFKMATAAPFWILLELERED